eukprot:CAMPEP_0198697488 /NCGR_PEP_ID=MMETSP1468-20131203/323561_1 /TAXON_ID=1461545 /ORGANISM="Mantoniella sp, Strain CCMP1436" /LENGTH=42 /DNA_ID= /DNA_START= /DNA_END= /DNA_ORIENTATION=
MLTYLAFVAVNCRVTVRRSSTSKYPVKAKYISPVDVRYGDPV